MTGVRALSFRNVSVGEIPPGAGRGVKLPHRYVAEKTSPRALELKKSPPSLRKNELCKALTVVDNAGRSFVGFGGFTQRIRHIVWFLIRIIFGQ